MKQATVDEIKSSIEDDLYFYFGAPEKQCSRKVNRYVFQRSWLCIKMIEGANLSPSKKPMSDGG